MMLKSPLEGPNTTDYQAILVDPRLRSGLLAVDACENARSRLLGNMPKVTDNDSLLKRAGKATIVLAQIPALVFLEVARQPISYRFARDCKKVLGTEVSYHRNQGELLNLPVPYIHFSAEELPHQVNSLAGVILEQAEALQS